MAPKQRRGAATVETLLTSALRVYAESGQQGFTVSAVTASSGVSMGSLYHHFGSFDGLAAALYIRCMNLLFDKMVSALHQADTARDGVHALVRAYLRFTRDHREVALFLHASAYSGYLAAHAEEIHAARSAQLKVLADWIAPRVARGEFAAVSTSTIEVLVIGPAAEAARRWLSDGYHLDLGRTERDLPERVWRSLRPD